MLAVGDLVWINSSYLPRAGWYIVKDVTHLGHIVDLIDMMNGRTYHTRLGPLSDIQERYSRSEFGYLEVHFAHLLRRYFELMGVPERTNWIVEGF